MDDIYTQCPEIEGDDYLLRLVQQQDAADLISCYGNSESIPFLNEDNFTYAFGRVDLTVSEMENTIQMWLDAYNERGFVRFAIVEKASDRVIGTIEMFNWSSVSEGLGLLRLDVNHEHETAAALSELLGLSDSFFALFDCGNILTKGFEKSQPRVDALKANGYEPFSQLQQKEFSREGYWAKKK